MTATTKRTVSTKLPPGFELPLHCAGSTFKPLEWSDLAKRGAPNIGWGDFRARGQSRSLHRARVGRLVRSVRRQDGGPRSVRSAQHPRQDGPPKISTMNSLTQPLHPSLTDKPAAPPLLCARRILDIEEKQAHHATGTADLTVRTVHEALKAAAFTEEEIIARMCARIKAADDAAADNGYMLDSQDCIAVLRGTWHGPLANDCPPKPAAQVGGNPGARVPDLPQCSVQSTTLPFDEAGTEAPALWTHLVP